jgi:hypothetical protein
MMKLATAALAVSLAVPAAAQQYRNCAPRAVVIERLATGYSETRQNIGLGSQGAVVEVFANPDTGTWTITVTSPAGVTCLVASGQSFETIVEPLPAKGDDA